MKKTIMVASVLWGAASTFAHAGGLVTNTNQNAAFLRLISQDAVRDITGLYSNPAGTAYLARGAHFSYNVMNARQSRDITTTFPLMALNVEHPGIATHKFEGQADAPVIPCLQFSYNWERWSVNASFAITGGGGKCEFDGGLGSFECLYAGNIYQSVGAQLAGVNAAYGTDLVLSSYGLSSYMKGRQYYFGLTVGGTYRLTDRVAAYVGLRAVVASCNYNGWVTDVTASTTSAMAVSSPVAAAVKQQTDQQLASALAGTSLSLNADQSGLGWTPIIGADWQIDDHWNVAVKYELKTRMRLENKSEMNDYAAQQAAGGNTTLAQFADGTSIAADVPATLMTGVQYDTRRGVRLLAGYHYYDDRHATQYGDHHKLIDHGTWEITAGAEWDATHLLTFSCGWQTTQYGLSDAYMNDLSFTTSSHTYGLGLRLNMSSHWSLDLGFMQTLYKSRDVETQVSPTLTKTDHYKRTNRVLGIGLNHSF